MNILFSSYVFFPCEKILALKRLKEKGDAVQQLLEKCYLPRVSLDWLFQMYSSLHKPSKYVQK